jgi:hypothetical protein
MKATQQTTPKPRTSSKMVASEFLTDIIDASMGLLASDPLKSGAENNQQSGLAFFKRAL